MRKNPEQTAWIVLWFSFIVFCVCTISIPLGVRAYLFNAVTVFTTSLTSIRGTVLARPVDSDQPIPLPRGATQSLNSPIIIFTDDTSQASLTFFDDSSVTLYNNTTLIIQQTNRPRFDLSPYPSRISLEIVKGRIRATVSPTDQDRQFVVKTLYADVQLSPGSYAFETDNTVGRITARSGSAVVTTQNVPITLTEGQLTIITANHPPTKPIPAEQNLIANGDFKQGLDTSWIPQIYVPADTITGTLHAITTEKTNTLAKADPLNAVTSSLQIISSGGQPVLEFTSQGPNNVHTEASIVQEINKDVQDFRSLRINAQIRLNNQSLPGGGQLGTEFPIMIQLNYRDAEGSDRTWYRGFYYDPPPNNYILYNEPNNANESITQFVWYPYESENLLTRLGAAKPIYIKSIRIYASGWIYNSMITDIKLLAED